MYGSRRNYETLLGMVRYGYARILTTEQNPDHQLDALLRRSGGVVKGAATSRKRAHFRC